MSRGHVGRTPDTDPILDLARAYDQRGWQLVPQRWKHDPRRPGNVPIRGLTGQIGHRTPEQVAQAVRDDVGTGARMTTDPGARPRGDLIPGARIPIGAVALDVDHYGGKRGHDTLAAMEAEHGPLPDTWTITARGPDSLARKWLYRLPPGTVLTDRWFGEYGGDIDVLRLTHRYVHAPGARHLRTDTPVLAYPPGGGPGVEELPPVDELPELPAAWCKAAAAYYHEQARVDGSGLRVDGEPEQLTDAHADAIVARAVRALEILPPSGAEFRNAVYGLARVCALHARALDGSPDEAELYTWQQFAEAHPGLVPDRDDEQWVAEAIAKAWNTPGWQLTDGPEPRDDAEPEHETPGPLSADEREEREQARADADYRRRKIAQERWEAAQRPPLRDLDDVIVWGDAMDQVAPPSFALEGLIPDRAVGWLGGPSGSYKSFVAVSLMVALCRGVTALGHPDFTVTRRQRVLYVAAEGSTGVVLRARAALEHLGLPGTRDHLIWREAVDLTDPRAVDRLIEFALEHEFTFIIVDTWRQVTPGIEENANTDVSLIMRRLLDLRDDHGIGSLLLDHTNKAAKGLADLTGAGAKRANADYVLMMDLPNGERGRSEQRTLRVAKLKDWEDGQSWPIRLEPVPSVADEADRPSAVALVGEVENDGPGLRDETPWHDVVLPSELDEAITGTGRSTAREIVRFLWANLDNADGYTATEIRGALGLAPKFIEQTRAGFRSSWHVGWSLARDEKRPLAEPPAAGNTSARFVLAYWLRDTLPKRPTGVITVDSDDPPEGA